MFFEAPHCTDIAPDFLLHRVLKKSAVFVPTYAVGTLHVRARTGSSSGNTAGISHALFKRRTVGCWSPFATFSGKTGLTGEFKDGLGESKKSGKNPGSD